MNRMPLIIKLSNFPFNYSSTFSTLKEIISKAPFEKEAQGASYGGMKCDIVGQDWFAGVFSKVPNLYNITLVHLWNRLGASSNCSFCRQMISKRMNAFTLIHMIFVLNITNNRNSFSISLKYLCVSFLCIVYCFSGQY